MAQIESRNRLKFYHQWLPNVVTDYHEMGTNSTYFFEPTEPFGSENPVVPRENYDNLNNLFAKYFVEAMDGIGSLYFTKEQYDNSYPGYGSTYPDIHGGLGMVFEQASSRGHLQRSNTGELTFAFTIRNHVTTSLATVKAAVENRAVLLNHQKQFFSGAKTEGQKSAIKGYSYGDDNDAGRTRAFTDLLLKHNIDVYKSQQPATNSSFVVPTNQTQYRMVRSIFEKVTTFYDSVFYDASAWTVALAYNMPHSELRATPKLGAKVQAVAVPSTTAVMAKYAYLIPWSDYYAPRLLQYLLENDVNVKTAFKGFTANTDAGKVKFGNGSLMVPVVNQKLMADQLLRIIQQSSMISGVKVYSVASGYSSSGIDLGSGNFRTISKPKPLMLIGGSSSSYEAGEIWHLLDTKVGMPITKVDQAQFSRVNLNDYNTLVLVSGNYNSLGEGKIADIKKWVQGGGTLITIRSATQWAIRSKLVDEELVDDTEQGDLPRTNFDLAREYSGSKRIGGSIYKTDVDRTHPLGFGYTSRELAVYKNSNVILKPSKSPYSTVVKYDSNPLLGGYVHAENLERIKNSASLVVSGLGRGRVILFSDNPNFRGFWYGTNRLFLNALFFGNLVSDPN